MFRNWADKRLPVLWGRVNAAINMLNKYLRAANGIPDSQCFVILLRIHELFICEREEDFRSRLKLM
eukprot:jgi/Chlat1/1030/Chrsp109S01461